MLTERLKSKAMLLIISAAVLVVAVLVAVNNLFQFSRVLVVICPLVSLATLASRSVHFLDKDQQLRVQLFTTSNIFNGPRLVILNPFYRSCRVVKAETLGTMDYVKVKNTADGLERIEHGPKLLFLGPYDEVSHRGQGTSLTSTEYILVEDLLSGCKRVVKGPSMWFPKPNEKSQRGAQVTLKSIEYIYVEDQQSGDVKTVKGPCVWCPGPYDTATPKKTAIVLQEDEYVRLKDVASGKHWTLNGKALVFLEPTWRMEGGVQKALVLKMNEYVKLQDTVTGKVVVHRGEKIVFPGPDEEYLDGGKKLAVEVDDEHAVLVRDKSTGQLQLVTEKQLFVPGPHEVIEEVRELIKLADHEAMVIKDKNGVFQYFYGSEERRSANQPRSFFLPPYAEIVKIWWSRGPRRERKDYSFERFDMRPHYMKFEFNCRTSDNVEIVLEGVFFWEIIDLPTMMRVTGDTSGDMCSHVRSQFITQTARMSLKQFMEEQHLVSRHVLDGDEDFYSARGIKMHSLEITRYSCADQSTAETLGQIIQETTNRMNRLSHAESENEVSLYRLQGQIEQAKQNSRLLEIQHAQTEKEACVAGKAESDRIGAFLIGLTDKVPSLEDRIRMWQVLRKTEALDVVSKGGANLYYTPNDVDLSIEARSNICSKYQVLAETPS